jgi:hypothetical protein
LVDACTGRPRVKKADLLDLALGSCLMAAIAALTFVAWRLPKNLAFGRDEIKVLTAVYEETLHTLRRENRSDPTTEIVAKKIIELAQRGECDPVRLRERAISSLSE